MSFTEINKSLLELEGIILELCDTDFRKTISSFLRLGRSIQSFRRLIETIGKAEDEGLSPYEKAVLREKKALARTLLEE